MLAGDGFSGHFSSLVDRAPVSDAARQGGSERGGAALWLGPEHDVVVGASLCHRGIILAGG
jgi:hypothetical protein